MTDDIGWSELEIRAALARTFGSDLDRQATRAGSKAGDHAGGVMGSRMGSKMSSGIRHHLTESAKYIVGPLVGAFAVERLGELVKDSIEGAVEDAAAGNRVKLLFGPASEEVDQFSEHAAKRYGLADDAARTAAAGFGILFRQAHLSNEENAKGSVQLVKLAADLAAFNHTDPEQAFTALQRGLAGSTRGLKPFGVLIDTAQQKAEALRLGLLKPVKDQAKIHAAQVAVLKDQAAYNDAIDKHGKVSLAAQEAQARLGSAQEALRHDVEGTLPPLTAQQKVLANQALILQQTKTQQGQFSRSSGDLAQQQKILAASFDNAKDRLGVGLMPIATDFVHLLNRDMVPAIDRASGWFEHKGGPAIHKYADELRPLANSVLPAVKTGLGDVVDVAKDLAPKVKAIFDAFNKLPAPLQKAIVIGAAAGYVGKKTGLLGAGMKLLGRSGAPGGGVAGEVLGSRGLTPANPLYVLDVAGGVGGGGKGPGGIVDPRTGRVAGEAAGEAKAIEAAKAAAGAVRAAGGGVASESAAAARAFKEAMAAHDAAVLKEALSFGKTAGARGLFRTLLAAPAGVAAGDIGAETPDNPFKMNSSKNQSAALFKTQFAGKGMPSDAVLKAFGYTPAQASSLLGLNIKSTATNLDALRANLGKTSRSIDRVTASGRAQDATFAQLAHSGDRYGHALLDLPPKVQTAILTPGLLKSRSDVQGLTRDVELTPKQVRQVYQLTGISKAKSDFDSLQSYMGRHQTFEQNIELATRPGVHVHGDVHVHGSSGDQWGARRRQQANTDGVRRGRP